MAPGLVSVNRWRPDDEDEQVAPLPFLGCVAVKP
ncbi:hypothetical protein [Salinispora arenicola]|nr:hypothetical protein [Salinispora arenicola]